MLFNVGDTCSIKGDDRHTWRVVWVDRSPGSHSSIPIWEVGLELVGEAWVRTKVVPLADLRPAKF